MFNFLMLVLCMMLFIILTTELVEGYNWIKSEDNKYSDTLTIFLVTFTVLTAIDCAFLLGIAYSLKNIMMGW